VGSGGEVDGRGGPSACQPAALLWHDLPKPPGERGALAEPVHVEERLDERLLRRILRQVVVAVRGVRRGVGQGLKRRDQPPERFKVAALDRRHERGDRWPRLRGRRAS
jgi:hypothetical protein